jgi:hypothetical protein
LVGGVSDGDAAGEVVPGVAGPEADGDRAGTDVEVEVEVGAEVEVSPLVELAW